MDPVDTPALTAVVLCGGSARRFGSDKTLADLGGRAVLDHVLTGMPSHWPVVCVGAVRPVPRDVTWCREEPPGGGPVAALAAALPHVDGPVVVVVGGDMPYAAPALPELVAALAADLDAEAALGRDGDGRRQPLLAAYRVGALLRAIPAHPAGTPLLRVVDRLRVLEVALTGATSLDVDTPEDLETARHRLKG